ncbi:hypothetical protein [Vibrio bivalvicida]|uniref:Uncharacterized protein n=1 Tax=Vibrio bivalvicida TaxID=1276888 RepID=A0A177Y2H7_9VIBR|nr:hypothetical protein [Vibrio bivalvicida]OAJ94695.1 hypothetical protein APB76_05270 [Vibrio bivalvicida]
MFIPAALLPNASVIILMGTLAALGKVESQFALPLLILAASISHWIAFLQGSFLTKLPTVQRWVSRVSGERLKTVDSLLFRHLFIALFMRSLHPNRSDTCTYDYGYTRAAVNVVSVLLDIKCHNVGKLAVWDWVFDTLSP